jgi:hypothetical protein
MQHVCNTRQIPVLLVDEALTVSLRVARLD